MQPSDSGPNFDCKAYKPVWFSWNNAGLIEGGDGAKPGTLRFVAYTDTEDFYSVQSVSVTSNSSQDAFERLGRVQGW